MGMRLEIMAGGMALALAMPAAAQIALPAVPIPPVGSVIDRAVRTVDSAAAPVLASASELARARLDRIDDLVRAHRALIERDMLGEPARRGEVLLTDPTPLQIGQAEKAGFKVLGREEIDGLGFTVVRLATPQGLSLAAAQKRLAKLLPDIAVSADLLHFQAGGSAATLASAAAAASQAAIATPVGMIDGAPGKGISSQVTKGFAKGAPAPSNHGSAVASLLGGAGVRRLLVADVYGSDRAGGNALALARGLGWLVGQGARVVTISLVGPSSPVVSRAVAAAQDRGVLIVAPVGNDGPAAPPSYPASYPGVIAVTAVDGRHRALIEAGRALHLDYAAPGADMLAADARGRWVKVRGTSYAAPLVAARAAAVGGTRAATVAALDREARDLGKPGPDAIFGRGLLCETCRRTR